MYGMRSQVILHPRRESQLRSYLWSTLLVALVLGCSSKVVPGPDSSAVVDLAEPPLEPMDLAVPPADLSSPPPDLRMLEDLGLSLIHISEPTRPY